MEIIKVNKQIRHHIWVKLSCEHCGEIVDDACGLNNPEYFFQIIPDMECPRCKKKADGPKFFKTQMEMISWLKTIIGDCNA